MNSEQSRLRSFDTWPSRESICTRTLAANGFYATGNLFEVECNWCHCRLSEWELSDNIEQYHIRGNLNCEFILNKHHCGNIPLSMSSGLLQMEGQSEMSADVPSVAKGYAKLDLLIEKDRLATFVNWPNPNITPQSLAKAGFFYRNRSDEVECAWCKGVIAQWEKQDNAFEEHRRFFPDCPRVQLGPLIEIANDGIRDLGIQQISPPKNPKFTSLHARLRTYSDWPIPDIQKPEDLAQAGLYYQKVDDQVRCFHCNMGLRSWEKEDDPWFEHAKWYPMCEFVRLVKGVNYVQEVQELTRTVQISDNTIVPMSVEEAMLTEPVKLALDMGINEDTIRNKIQEKVSETGRPFATVDDLLKAVFDEQDNINADLENTAQTPTGIPQINISNSSIKVNNDNSTNNSPRNETTIDHGLNGACSTTSSAATNMKKGSAKESSESPNIKTKVENASQHSKANGKPTSDREYLEEENRKLKDARLCKVCLDEEVGVVYLPCGHLVTCVQCAPGVNQCPMCRTKIKGFVRTYLS